MLAKMAELLFISSLVGTVAIVIVEGAVIALWRK